MRRYGVLFVGILLLLCGSSRDGGSAQEIPAGGQILATYHIYLAGFNLGEFRLTATFQGSNYKMQGKGRFSILGGLLYRGSGTTKSTGKLTKAGPEPSMFKVSYRGGGKRQQRRMSFADGAVSQVSITPRKKQNPRRVPVTKEQLENVLDPLSAFLYAHSDNPRGDLNVCHKTVPVFDGWLRFNIVLTPKRADSLLKKAPTNLSGPAAVCQVKFMPIGGYRPDNPGIKFLSQTDEIEIWLVSLPQTTLYLPYRIVVPTPLGRGSLTLTQIKINLDGPASNFRP